MSERALCTLEFALGRQQRCPRGACPFWEEGGAVLEAGCGLERLGLDLARPDLAGYLLELRRDLEHARSREEQQRGRAAFAHVIPPDVSGR